MKYRNKLGHTVEAMTFSDFIEYGKQRVEPSARIGGMPWSFEWEGHHVSHENDDHYIIGGALNFKRGEILASLGSGRIFILPSEEFYATHEVVGEE